MFLARITASCLAYFSCTLVDPFFLLILPFMPIDDFNWFLNQRIYFSLPDANDM